MFKNILPAAYYSAAPSLNKEEKSALTVSKAPTLAAAGGDVHDASYYAKCVCYPDFQKFQVA